AQPLIDYSTPSRKPAAAAKVPTTKLTSVSAHKIVNGVPNDSGPTVAVFEAATPKISTGTVSGITRTASNSPPRRKVTDSAAPINPMKVSAGVPTRSVSATVALAAPSRFMNRPNSGVATTSGRPVVSQCAIALVATASSSGVGALKIRSSEPSS